MTALVLVTIAAVICTSCLVLIIFLTSTDEMPYNKRVINLAIVNCILWVTSIVLNIVILNM